MKERTRKKIILKKFKSEKKRKEKENIEKKRLKKIIQFSINNQRFIVN